MHDNDGASGSALLGEQIRRLRQARGWSLEELARRAGTSAPALHRYESGWDRFALATLRRIAGALGARLDVRLVPAGRSHTTRRRPSRRHFLRLLRPLFWDKALAGSDLEDHAEWVLGRVLMFGNRRQVDAARAYFGDETLRRALARRGVDARTRAYWQVILGRLQRAS